MRGIQQFDRIESPTSVDEHCSIKNELTSSIEDTTMFIPDSLVGLAEPAEFTSDIDDDRRVIIIDRNRVQR
jgi:hypothetical protein